MILMTIDMKETLFEGNVTIDLWSSGLINIETRVFLPRERATLEILEQVHVDCPSLHRCLGGDSCLGHCDDNEIISYLERKIWVYDEIKDS